MELTQQVSLLQLACINPSSTPPTPTGWLYRNAGKELGNIAFVQVHRNSAFLKLLVFQMPSLKTKKISSKDSVSFITVVTVPTVAAVTGISQELPPTSCPSPFSLLLITENHVVRTRNGPEWHEVHIILHRETYRSFLWRESHGLPCIHSF